MSETHLPTASLKTLVGTVFICAAFVIAYGLLGLPPHPFIRLVISVAPLVAAISWFQADARVRHVPLVHDMGFFLWLAWPVLIPWYVAKTRGRHAFPFALLIMLAIVGPFFLTLAFEAARSVRAR